MSTTIEHRPLRYDASIESAARAGNNDLALELSIEQRHFYEMFCDNPAEMREWRRRHIQIPAPDEPRPGQRPTTRSRYE